MTATDGEKAIEAIRENPAISLILLDIDLGRGIDGTETAQEILQIRELPIIFHTSHAGKEYVDKHGIHALRCKKRSTASSIGERNCLPGNEGKGVSAATRKQGASFDQGH